MNEKIFDSKIIEMDNGLKILSIKKETGLMSINLGIKIGALYENKEEKGISHFIEHMLFKGTQTRDNEKLNNELENIGGDYNAYTDYTCTVYSIDGLNSEMENSLEILSDMVINSKFKEEEVEKERGVILSELRSSKDDIEDLSFKKINEYAFRKSGLKMDVLGTEKIIKSFNKEKLVKYYEEYYAPNNSVISIVSSYSHEYVQALVKKYFGAWSRRKINKKILEDEKNREGIFQSYKKEIEQSTIVYLYTFYGLSKEEELSLKVLNHKLGESANSILFRELRENRGIAYDVYSHMDSSEHIKTLYIYTAVEEENLEEALDIIDKSIVNIKSREIKTHENTLSLMKKIFKTSLIATLESGAELGHYGLMQLMENESVYEFIEDMKRLEYINSEHIYNIAEKILRNPSIHILRSEKSEEDEQ